MRPYAQYAERYLAAGYFPIPAQGKRVIKNSHHGRDKPLVTMAEVRKWSRLHPDANIAARLPRDVIGIDVDAYGDKPGEESLARLEEQLGPLPATIMSTSRDDWVSGIRLFRVPQQYWSVIWPGKAGEGIDIIWHGNRYMIVWPSIHPSTGLSYRWYDQNDDRTLDELSIVPDLSDDWLPDFPKDWCDYFARVDQQEGASDVASTADWIKSHAAGEMCDYMATTVDKAADEITANAHDSAKSAVYNILRSSVRGHTGGSKALAKVRTMFLEEVAHRDAERRRGAESEWRRSVDGAVRKAQRLGEEQGFETHDPCTEDLSDIRPNRISRALLWADDVEETQVRWLQKPLLPFGSLVIIDGDPGQGKSTITNHMVAQATNGQPVLPYGEHFGEPITCGIIGAEDDLGSVVVGRLRASGWERGNQSVAFFRVPRKRGKIQTITFPDGIEEVRSWILTGGLELVIVDPITSFLGEDVKSHVDASVRRALAPLVDVAAETGACIVLVRHLNKNGQMQAIYRGGGSIAFSAIARSGLITGRLPDGDDRFGLAQVKCSHAERMKVSLAYSVVGWPEDKTIPVIEWHGEADVDADRLASGSSGKPGPSAEAQIEVEAVLTELFRQRARWPHEAIMSELRAAGVSTNKNVLSKVKKSMDLRSRRIFRRGAPDNWEWYLGTEKQHISSGEDDV